MRTITLLSLLLNLFIAVTYGQNRCKWAYPIKDTSFYENTDVIIDHHHNIIIAGVYHPYNTFHTGAWTYISTAYIIKYDSNGTVLWRKDLDNAYQYFPKNLACDANDDIYIAGNFSVPVLYLTPLDTVRNGSGGGNTALLVKYDANGNYKWAVGTHANSSANAVTIDNNDNVIWGGYFSYDINFSGHTLHNTYLGNIFLAKYSSAGTYMWAKQGASTGFAFNDNNIVSIAVANSGNIFATGYNTYAVAYDTATINMDTIANQIPWHEGFVAKFDSIGNILWHTRCRAPLSPEGIVEDLGGNKITIDDSENVFVGGSFLDSIHIISPGNNARYSHGFLAKLSTNGTNLWIKEFGPDSPKPFNHVEVEDLALDRYGNPYIIGFYDTAMNIGTIPVSTDSENTFVAILDNSTGNTIKVVAFSNTYRNVGSNIAIDMTNGNIAIVGGYRFGMLLDSVSLPYSDILGDPYLAYLTTPFLAVNDPHQVKTTVTLYPNPASDILNLSFTSGVYHNITIVSSEGRNLFNTETNNTHLQLDISKLPPGNYFLSASDKNKNVQTKQFTKL